MTTHTVGIIMHGVTGRMGTNQHLLRSIVPIIQQGGVRVGTDTVIVPAPLLVGRSKDKLESVAKASGISRWSTDLDGALSDRSLSVYFDAQTTLQRAASVSRAIAAGKHIYCEKPIATDTKTAYDLYAQAQRKGVKHGVVQDKLWLPGLLKLADLRDKGFFGRIFSVHGEFGYWVYEGDTIPAQRPSWNYRQEDGGGIVVDMLCHWRYVLDGLFGKVKAVSCRTATHIPARWNEAGARYEVTADDSAYSTFELEGGIIAHINSSWATRVRRDDLLTLLVDGTLGSAVAGLRDCWIQPYGATPRPIWNPDIPNPIDFYQSWQKMPEQRTYDNAFKVQWELFLRHVALGEPFRWTLLEGARGVQLAEKGLESSRERRWVDLPDLAEIPTAPGAAR